MDRDRLPDDLLIGALALCGGLIGASDLASALGSWAPEGGGRPLAEVLASRGLIGEAERSALEAMATVEAGRLRALLGRDWSAPLATATTVPGPEGDTESMPGAGPGPSGDGADDERAGVAGGRFRVVRQHEAGGLGVVFVAVDNQLHREVALKQIHLGRADDPGSRSRFLREAEITGGLEHPNIVPVYGLGRDADGRPYYAMRLIRGDSLKKEIAGFHDDPGLARDPGARALALRQLLRRLIDVCNAIDYAHGRGVVHRDLKPKNIMVGPHGETLVVDWGLAKPLGRAEAGGEGPGPVEPPLIPSSSGSAVTFRGEAIGTPAYMSPEQASGDWDRLGFRSDVYGLGATLYCILTGKPPYTDAKGPALLDKVRAGVFPPPRARRPSIPRPLEAICLRAMAARPEDRYDTARALADDLERWMADEPVSARPEPILERLARWGRQNRRAVAAAVVLLVLAVAILAVDDVRVGREKLKADDAAKRALASRDEANQSYRNALDAIGKIYNETTRVKLANLPQAEEVRLEVAGNSLAQVERLLASRPDDPSTRFGAYKLAKEVGHVRGLIGPDSEAAKAAGRALELIGGLADEFPDDVIYNIARIEIWTQEGGRHSEQGRLAEAGDCFRRGIEFADAWLARDPKDARFGRLRGRGLARRARVLLEESSPGKAAEEFRRAIDTFGPLVDVATKSAFPRRELAEMHCLHARALRESGKLAEAEQESREALRRAEALLALDEKDNDFRHTVALARVELGCALAADPTRQSDAFAMLDGGVDGLKALVDDYPKIRPYWQDLADALLRRGEALQAAGRADPARDDWRRAKAEILKLLGSSPQNPIHQARRRLILDRLGEA